eukprot:36894_1
MPTMSPNAPSRSGGSTTFTTSRTASKPKYREMPAGNELPQNIMFDRRVIRGSTYSAHHVQEELTMGQSTYKKHKQKRQKRDAFDRDTSTPEPVEGRQHMEVQTLNYLEEITERPAERSVESQTDALKDRPISPMFMPKLSGPSKATQIEAGDLFDFDEEVKPILEVLIGKTLDQALMEVLEEEELAEIHRHQELFEQSRNASLAECQRLEGEERRRFEEKERRMEQDQLRKAEQKEKSIAAAARSVAQGSLFS